MKKGPRDDTERITSVESRARILSRRHRLHEQGLCADCGARIEEGREGSWRCLHCTEWLKEYERGRRQRLISEGICVSCGKQKARYQRTQCEACAARIAENRRMRLEKQNEK